MYTKTTLVNQLKTLGVQRGDLVMLHASVRAVGKIVDGADQIHQAVTECISPTGTLLMYAGCPPELEMESDATFSYPTLPVPEDCPVFGPKLTRANPDYGILAELFRCSPGTMCSDNPIVRMAASGAKAEWLISNHPLNYGYGKESPLEKLYQHHGKILLLGSDLAHVTILHYAENIAPIAEKRIVYTKVAGIKNAQRTWLHIEDYDSDNGACAWPPRFFATILQHYLESHKISALKVGDADSYLLDAKTLVDFAVEHFCSAARSLCASSPL